MNQDKRFQLLPFLALCLIFIGTPWLYAQNAKTNFQFTILKSTCEPQTEVLLKINGRSNEYRTDKEGVIVFDFDASSSYTYTASCISCPIYRSLFCLFHWKKKKTSVLSIWTVPKTLRYSNSRTRPSALKAS